MKKPQYVSLKTETRQGYLLLTLSSNIVLKVLAGAAKKKSIKNKKAVVCR